MIKNGNRVKQLEKILGSIEARMEGCKDDKHYIQLGWQWQSLMKALLSEKMAYDLTDIPDDPELSLMISNDLADIPIPEDIIDMKIMKKKAQEELNRRKDK